jgi:coproporphyrinogen III oxidase
MQSGPTNRQLSALDLHLRILQDRICDALEEADGQARFSREEYPGERGGQARPRLLSDGLHLEKAAVNYSHTRGEALPDAATKRRPELAGKPFQAHSISLIVHPRNPYAPTTHANFRFFRAGDGASSVWWFGGGYDLTPYYGFDEDAVHWHRTARGACGLLSPDAYARFKRWCDEYFHLAHRQEPRGIGGVFFDDLNEPGFVRCFEFWTAVSSSFLPAYLPILERRKNSDYSEREREWQLLRRGRYVEFNLLYDRGTRYGLQAGGRVESILASLPPLVRWVHAPPPAEGSDEARLMSHFLRPRDWLAEDDPAA